MSADGPDGRPSDPAKDRMIATNAAQRDYYDAADGTRTSRSNSLPTNLWRVMRQRAQVSVSGTARRQFYNIHREWMGDLSGAKVLELGCGTGSNLSRHMADTAGSYHALDLSGVQVATLRAKIGDRPNAHFHVGDVLSDTFTETGFDVIYARSVFHHFEVIDVLFDRLAQIAARGARILTLDPVQAWPPIRALRLMFRPFQSDAAWEFPFTAATLRKIETRFTVDQAMALFRRAKWAMALGVISPALGARYGDRWYGQDLDTRSTFADRCSALQVSYMLRMPDAG